MNLELSTNPEVKTPSLPTSIDDITEPIASTKLDLKKLGVPEGIDFSNMTQNYGLLRYSPGNEAYKGPKDSFDPEVSTFNVDDEIEPDLTSVNSSPDAIEED